MLGADEVVLQTLSFRFSRIEDQLHPRRETHVATVCLRQVLQERAGLGLHLRWIDRHLAKDRRDDAAFLLDERDKEMLRSDLGMVLLGREVLRPDDGFLSFLRVLVEIHCLMQRCSWSRRLRSRSEEHTSE